MDIDEFNRQIGIRIQRFRKQRGLTQEALADAIERSTDTVCNIERGFGSTRMETFCRISDVLNISVAEIFDISQAMPVDRARLKLIEQLLALVAMEDHETIEALIAQAEILIRVKARATKTPRSRT